MVLIKNFLAIAAVLATAVVAADEPNNDAEAAAFWGQLDTISARDLPSPLAKVVAGVLPEHNDRDNRGTKDDGKNAGNNRDPKYDGNNRDPKYDDEREYRDGKVDNSRRPVPRPPKTANPYQDRKCPRNTKLDFPKKLTCEQNKCSQSFLSTRDADRHCPSEAFGFCCLWLSAGNYGKKWAVKNDWIYKKAPYTRGCSERRDRTQDVIRKIDDVCGCTIKQKVKVETDTEYFQLRDKKAGHPSCQKQRRY